MPRIARVVAVGLPHHITQRGNYGQDVFVDDADYLKYSEWLQEYTTKYGLSILAYCLMRNHVHFIVIPKKKIHSPTHLIPLICATHNISIRGKMQKGIYGRDVFIPVFWTNRISLRL